MKSKGSVEEQAVYGIAAVDEGNWLRGQFTVKGGSWGAIEMPMTFLPAPIRRRLQKGEQINLRLLIAEDVENRVRIEEGKYQYRS